MSNPNKNITQAAEYAVGSGSSPLVPQPGSRFEQISSTATSGSEASKVQSQITEIKGWMIGVIVVILAAFFSIVYDSIKEKEIIINYGNLSDKNMERYSDLKKAMYELQLQLNKEKQLEIEKENSKLMRQNECLLKANQLGKADCLFQ